MQTGALHGQDPRIDDPKGRPAGALSPEPNARILADPEAQVLVSAICVPLDARTGSVPSPIEQL